MTNNALPKKRRYEPPSVTSPESDPGSGSNFSPAGITGCGHGAFGATCAPGTSPQGTSGSCNTGGSPLSRNCSTGNSAGNDCLAGNGAVNSCSDGTAVQGDCTNGNIPMGAFCTVGTTATNCSDGTGGGG